MDDVRMCGRRRTNGAFSLSLFRSFDVSLFRCFGVAVFRCFGVSVLRCFGVSVVFSPQQLSCVCSCVCLFARACTWLCVCLCVSACSTCFYTSYCGHLSAIVPCAPSTFYCVPSVSGFFYCDTGSASKRASLTDTERTRESCNLLRASSSGCGWHRGSRCWRR